jgi:hypothetical protein
MTNSRTDRGKLIGQMYGEHAVQASFMAITASYANGRSVIGGTVLSSFCTTDKWERWQGTIILIPDKTEVLRRPSLRRLEQMMMTEMLVDELWRKI